MGQHAGHPAHSRAAPARRRSSSAMRTTPSVSLVPKMARKRRRGDRLPARAQPARRGRSRSRDIAELIEFARDDARHRRRSQPHDLAFASERLKEHRYAFSDQEVRQYFPEPQVLGGLFRVAETLYGITIRKAAAATWHPDVRFFEIRDAGGTPHRRVLSRPLRARRQAGRRVDGRGDRPPPRRRRASSIPSPISRATCRRPNRAARRRSRTTRSRRSSTSSGTGCTSC